MLLTNSIETSGEPLAMGRGRSMRIARAGSALSLRLVLGACVTIGTSAYLVHTLSFEQWASLALPIALFPGIQDVLYRGFAARLARSRTEPDWSSVRTALLGQGRVAALVASALVGIGAVEAVSFHRGAMLVLMASTGVAALAYGLRSVPVALLERRLQFHKVAVIELAEAGVFAGIAISIAATGAAVGWFALAFIARGVVGVIAGALTLGIRRKEARLPRGMGRPTLRDAYAVDMILISILSAVAIAIPQLAMTTTGELAVAGQVQTAFLFFTYSLVLVQVPIRIGFVVVAHERDPVRIAQGAQQAVEQLARLVSPALVAVMALAPITAAMFGAHWAPAGRYVAYLAPGYLAAGVFWPILLPLATGSGRTRIVVRSLLVYDTLYAILSVVALTVTSAGVAIAYSISTPVLVFAVARGLTHSMTPINFRHATSWVVGATVVGLSAALAATANLIAAPVIVAIVAIAIWCGGIYHAAQYVRRVPALQAD